MYIKVEELPNEKRAELIKYAMDKVIKNSEYADNYWVKPIVVSKNTAEFTTKPAKLGILLYPRLTQVPKREQAERRSDYRERISAIADEDFERANEKDYIRLLIHTEYVDHCGLEVTLETVEDFTE